MRARGCAIGLGILGVVASATAEVFIYTGECESPSFSACCLEDPEVECAPGLFIWRNNWGRVGPCGSCPDADDYPGADDDVQLGLGVPVIDGFSVTINSIVSDPGAGGITLLNGHLASLEDIVLFQLSLYGGSMTTAGDLCVGTFDFEPTTSPVTAAAFKIGDLFMDTPGQHRFAQGPVSTTGTVMWSAGSVTTDQPWTNDGVFAITLLPGEVRNYSGGFVNKGQLTVTNDDPPGGQAEVTFGSGGPVHILDLAAVALGERVTLEVFGGGFTESSVPIDLDDDARLVLGGFDEGFELRDGTVVRDVGIGTAAVVAALASVPNGATTTVNGHVDVDGALHARGTLIADSMRLRSSSDIFGHDRGTIITSSFEVAGSFHDLDDIDIFVDTLMDITSATVIKLNETTLTLQSGATGAVGGAGTKTIVLRTDEAGAVSGVVIEPGAVLSATAPSVEVTGHFNHVDDQVFDVQGTLDVQSPSFDVFAFVRLQSGPGSEVVVRSGAQARLFGDAAIGGALTLDPGSDFLYSGLAGKTLSLDGAIAEWNASFRTPATAQEIVMTDTTVSVGAAGTVDLVGDTIACDGVTFDVDGAVRCDGTTLVVEGPVCATGAGVMEFSTSHIDTGDGAGGETFDVGVPTRFLAGLCDVDAAVRATANVEACGGATCVRLRQQPKIFDTVTAQGGARFRLETIAEMRAGSFAGGILDVGPAGDLTAEELICALGGISVGLGGAAPGGPNGRVSVSRVLTFDMTDEATWSWAPDAVLELAGGVGAAAGDWEAWTALEVGGADLGTDPVAHVGDPAGFDANFDLSVLRVAAGAHAFIEDAVDNGNRRGGAESLYVDVLEFGDASARLNLNGIHLYYGTLVGDVDQMIDVPVDCTGDVDGTGEVGFTDLLAILAAWGPCPGEGPCPADLDGNGVVDFADLVGLLSSWGPCA